MLLRSFHVFGVLFLCAVVSPAQSLRQEADKAGILVGAAVNVHYLSETSYTSTLAREFSMVEPEDAMKWAVLRPDEKTFDFADADRIVEFALAHGQKIRGHNLVWGTHNPDWLTQGTRTPQQFADLLHAHISKVVGHFRGEVFAWDVVNEAFDEKGKLRDSIWHNQSGIGNDFIAQAFRWAHEADPKALLFYNEAEAGEINAKSDAVYAMAQDFRKRGIPMDGIGFEMHIYNLAPNISSIAANFERFAKLGMQIHITEMDVALPVYEDRSLRDPADLQRQADLYGQIVRICLQTTGCTAIQTWGVTDKYSWLGWATHNSKGDGLLFNRQYQPKPAYSAVKQALAQHEK